MGQSLRKSVLGDDYNLENLSIVWLDVAVNSTPENLNVQEQLRTLINHLKTFDNTNDCLQYIRNLPKQNRIILIVSGRLGREIVPRIHRLRQVSCIYVYCMDKAKNEKWAHKFAKVKDVVINLDELVGQIRSDRARRNISEIDEPFSFNIYRKNHRDEQTTMNTNNTFINFELIIDCLLHTKPHSIDKPEFLSICKEIYQGHKDELLKIDEFEKTYTANDALSWYTRDSLMYRLLNKALQCQRFDLLYLIRFYLHDIKAQLKNNKCPSPIRVYCGQFLSHKEFDILKNSTGDFISINTLLSTNFNRQKALKYLTACDDYKGVLFEIDANPSLSTIKSFGLTEQDDEILFMVGSIFSINNIHQQEDGMTIVRMTLCSDDDSQLKSIFQSLKSDNTHGETNFLLFGDVLWKIGKFSEAEKYYQRLLTALPQDKYSEIAECYYALGNIAMEKNDYVKSFELHQKSLDIKKEKFNEKDPKIADSYNSMADIERKKGNSSQALELYNKALEIWTEAYGNDHPKVAMCFNNIGCIYGEEKDYEKTLEYQEKALKIMEKNFSSDHLCLGQAHNNIGSVYRYLENYELALEHYQISIKIKLKSFSSKHPTIASTYINIANVYEEMNLLQQALEYYEKAASIYRHRYPPTYPDNKKNAEDIRRIKNKLKN